MPRGAPDDSDVRKEGITVRIDDMGELAVRMGSSMLYHRGGELAFLDTFEAGLAAWKIGALVDDASVVLTNTYALSSGLSVACDTGALINNGIALSHEEAPIDTDLLGFHIAFSSDEDNMILWFRVIVTHAELQYRYAITYDAETGILTYSNNEDDDIPFATHGLLRVGAKVFHHLKMIVNYNNPFYHKLFLDEQSYNMESYECWTRPVEYTPRLYVGFEIQIPTGQECIVYVDDIILTQNEV